MEGRNKRSLPELPDARRKRYVNEYGLPDMMLSFLQAQRLLQIFLRRRRENAIMQKP